MTYEQTVDYLFNRLPNYQKQGKSAYKVNLSNITSLCEILDNPQDKIKTIHVAGTNGKGSTCHMLASIFQEAGYKVGLFTSPHLLHFRERVKINGEMISKEEVISFVENFQNKFESIEPSFFEWTTALAFQSFEKNNVDIAIIETGLGGRLDSTNIINPELSVITNISKDHSNILGNTLEEIAKEKAGIIKENTPVIIGEKNKELKTLFAESSKQKNSSIHFSGSTKRYTTDLKGAYQYFNINTTIKAIEVLQKDWDISTENIHKGLSNVVKNTRLRGRWEVISNSPKIICDVGHNVAGVKEIVSQLNKKSFDKLHIVWGMANDKDVDSILKLLPTQAQYYFCAANTERAFKAYQLRQKGLENKLIGQKYDSVSIALNTAIKRAEKSDLIFIGGSTFTVAEILS